MGCGGPEGHQDGADATHCAGGGGGVLTADGPQDGEAPLSLVGGLGAGRELHTLCSGGLLDLGVSREGCGAGQ